MLYLNTIIPLGVSCFQRAALTRHHVKASKDQGELSFPFDLVAMSLNGVFLSLSNKFKNFFDEIAFDENLGYFHNRKLGVDFHHDKDIAANKKEALVKRYSQRIANLYSLIASGKKLCYVLNTTNDLSDLDLLAQIRSLILPHNFIWTHVGKKNIVNASALAQFGLHIPSPYEDFTKQWWLPEFQFSRTGQEFEKKYSELLGDRIKALAHEPMKKISVPISTELPTAEPDDIEFISLGTFSFPTHLLFRWKIQAKTLELPFDQIFLPPKSVASFLENDFAEFLDNLEYDEKSGIFRNRKYGVGFNDDRRFGPDELPVLLDIYKQRISNFRKLLASGRKLSFILATITDQTDSSLAERIANALPANCQLIWLHFGKTAPKVGLDPRVFIFHQASPYEEFRTQWYIYHHYTAKYGRKFERECVTNILKAHGLSEPEAYQRLIQPNETKSSG